MLNFNFKTLANSLCVYVENIKSGCDVRYIHDIAHFISVHLLYATTLQAIQAYPCLDIVKRKVDVQVRSNRIRIYRYLWFNKLYQKTLSE